MDTPQDTPHLSDLFSKGETVTVTDANGTEYSIFVRRPGPNQQQAAVDAANARMASYTIQYEEKSGPRYESIAAAVRSTDDKEELVDQVVMYVESEVRQQAYNDVLHDPEVGSDWSSDDGSSYVDILAALTARLEEIKHYNSEVGPSDRIDVESDDIANGLMERQSAFEREVDERAAVLMEEERAKHRNKPVAQLQNELIKSGIEVEGKLYWYEEYQMKMLYYACRYPDDVSRLYFDDPYDVLELPQYIRERLYREYENLELGSEQLKNSLSLLNS